MVVQWVHVGHIIMTPVVCDDLLVSSCFNDIRTSSPMNLGIAMVASYVAALEGKGQGCWSYPWKGYGGNSLNDYLSFEFIYFKGSGCLAHPSLNVIIFILWILVAEWSLIAKWMFERPHFSLVFNLSLWFLRTEKFWFTSDFWPLTNASLGWSLSTQVLRLPKLMEAMPAFEVEMENHLEMIQRSNDI